MQSINSRIYTNVILTVIAVLLAVLAFQPVFKVSSEAQAQRAGLSRSGDESASDSRSGRGSSSASVYGGDEKVAAATKDLAAATREIAEALRETAKAQEGIGAAVGRFTAALTADTGK